MVFLEQVSTSQSNQLAKIPFQIQCTHPIAPNSTFLYLQTSSKFYHHHLKDYGYGYDPQKQLIPMYPFKHILLLKFSCIEFIEHLTKDKSIEDQCVIYLHSHTKDWFTFELQGQKDDNLIQSLG